MLVRVGRTQLIGSATGIVALASVVPRGAMMVLAGTAVLVLGPQLGRSILLGPEFLVAADIVRTSPWPRPSPTSAS